MKMVTTASLLHFCALKGNGSPAGAPCPDEKKAPLRRGPQRGNGPGGEQGPDKGK